MKHKEFEDVVRIISRDQGRKTIDERDHLLTDIAKLTEGLTSESSKKDELFMYKQDIFSRLSTALIEIEKAN